MRVRKLAVPGYLMVVAFLLFPVADMLVATWPLRAGSPAWRFSTVSLFGRTLVTPLLGLFLASALATLLEHPRVLRALSVLDGIVALAIAGIAGVYVLDALQLRGQVSIQQEMRFRMGSAAALGKLGLAFLVTLTLSIACWKAAGAVARRARHSRSEKGEERIVVSAEDRERAAAPPRASSGLK